MFATLKKLAVGAVGAVATVFGVSTASAQPPTITVDYEGALTPIVTQVSAMLTDAVPIIAVAAGALLCAGLAWKFGRKFIKA